MKNILVPASVLAGTIIGAGVFSLPFVFKEVGLTTGFFYLALFSVIYFIVYLLYADLIVRTPGDHRFVGFSRIYLGKMGFFFSLFIGLLELFFTLTVYLILAPSFSGLFVGNNLIYHLFVFWAVGSVIILLNVRKMAASEFLMVFAIVAIMALIFIFGINGFIKSDIDFNRLDLSKFLAVGPILFALSGTLAIPELINYFRNAQVPVSLVKKSAALGALIPFVVYGLFVMGVLGLSGTVSGDAVSGLIGAVPGFLLGLVGLLGILSLLSSYIVVGLNARHVLEYDIKLPKIISILAVLLLPLTLYFSGFQNFVGTISFVGAVFLPLEIIFIVFMWLRAEKKSEMPPILVGKYIRFFIPPILVVFFMVLIYGIITLH